MANIPKLQNLLVLIAGKSQPITPDFNTDITDYQCLVPVDATNANVLATPADRRDNVIINSIDITQAGQTKTIPLTTGENMVPIILLGADYTNNTYRLNILRDDSSFDLPIIV